MSSKYAYVKDSRNKRKLDMVYVMGGKCQLCGYNKTVSALEFHHINPALKTISFNKAQTKNWEITKEELKKSILLCANCHREVHDNLDNFLNLKSSYDEEKAEEISKQIENLKTHKEKYCIICGAIISSKATYCEKCAALQKRTVIRPSREELKNLIRTKPFLQIGKDFGVSDNAIRKWCDSYNLPRKVSDIKKYSDEEWSQV